MNQTIHVLHKLQEQCSQSLYSNPSYMKAKLYKCSNLNEQLDPILQERVAIEFDKLVLSVKKECLYKKPIDNSA